MSELLQALYTGDRARADELLAQNRELTVFEAASGQLAELLEELSLAARIESGRYDPAIQEVDSVQLVRSAVEPLDAGLVSVEGEGAPVQVDVAAAEVERLAEAIDAELERGLDLRERGAGDKKTYRVHNSLGEPCYVCGTPIARVDFEEHTIYYCPECQTGGRVLKDRRLSRLLR